MKREDIEKMMKEAEQHAEEDKANLENAQLRNEAESMVYTTNKTLKEFKDKIPKEIYDKVDAAKNEVDEALKGEDYGRIKTSLNKLKDTLQEIGSSMYGKGEGGTGAGPEPGSGQGESSGPNSGGGDGGDGTVNADFKVEK